MHATLQDPMQMTLSAGNLTTMDLWIPKPSGRDWDANSHKNTTKFFSGLSSYKHLQRLFIGVTDSRDRKIGNLLDICLLTQTDPSARLRNLEELSLFGFSINASFYQRLTNIVDFERLTHLSLMQCGPVHELLFGLARSTGIPYMELRHLALEILDVVQPSSQLSLAQDLELVLKRCKHLESFAFEWHESTFASESVLQSLQAIGAGLKSLSLHRHGDVNALEPDHFKQMCSVCPNIEQLGFNIADEKLAEYRFQEIHDHLVGLLI
jgi:hypothetical protein